MTRKRYLGIKLVILSILFVVISIFSINIGKYSFFEETIVEEKVFTDVEKIQVDLMSFSVDVVESDVENVTVKNTTRQFGLKPGNTIIIQEDDKIVRIFQEKKSSFLFFSTGSIVIEVPKNKILEYGINNVSGSIDHNAKSKNLISAISISGSVRIHQGGESAFVESVSGSVKTYASFVDLRANSISGSVRAFADSNSKQVDISSISGSVGVQLENVSGYDMTYSTTSGSVRDDYKATKYPKSGHVQEGDALLRINASTVSGSIRLADWIDE